MSRPTLALVPSQHESAVLVTATGSRTIKGTKQLLEQIEQLEPSLLLGVMGGPAQNVLVRAVQLGHAVARIPWFRLYEMTDLHRGADSRQVGQALLAAWEQSAAAFYALEELDERMYRLRELTRTRQNIQQTFRIPAAQQYAATRRDLEMILPEGRQFAAIRRTFAEPAMIRGAFEDEAILESAIKATVRGMPIWDWLHPSSDSLLPKVKGLGPALGGALIAEIGDIRRFPTRAHLRSYARYRVDPDGSMPRRRKGTVSSWNRYLDRAVWLWSTDQVLRYDHVWKTVTQWRLAVELKRHPAEVPEQVTRRDGAVVTVQRFTLQHCYSRAQRWVGRELLNYVHDLWTAGLAGDPEEWYVDSRWPDRFATAERELAAWGEALLEDQLPKRRKAKPV